MRRENCFCIQRSKIHDWVQKDPAFNIWYHAQWVVEVQYCLIDYQPADLLESSSTRFSTTWIFQYGFFNCNELILPLVEASKESSVKARAAPHFTSMLRIHCSIYAVYPTLKYQGEQILLTSSHSSCEICIALVLLFNDEQLAWSVNREMVPRVHLLHV